MSIFDDLLVSIRLIRAEDRRLDLFVDSPLPRLTRRTDFTPENLPDFPPEWFLERRRRLPKSKPRCNAGKQCGYSRRIT